MIVDKTGEGLLLGRQVPVSERYSPQLLFPISRSQARDQLGLDGQALPFTGMDIWHAYELSWLDENGRPVSWVGRFYIPANSRYLVESKSFKLYLNSLNNERLASAEAARELICADVSHCAGAPVSLELLSVEASGLTGQPLPGQCLDHLHACYKDEAPVASMLVPGQDERTQRRGMSVHTHLLRSLCPVTGQPDWASVWIDMRGGVLDKCSLLHYLLCYRNHQEFHEQCVERIFRDIQQVCEPSELHVQAFYTRRGGLDITPFRSTGQRQPLPRMNRQ
ncbi:MAG: NADPH-dependent 7-cyano-7-deazaguanine reductase QueF [Parahaliea sp.]